MSTAPDTQAPDKPTDLGGRSWKDVLKRTVKEAQDDNLTDWAAALTYYAVLALFPALIVLVALLGLFGQFPDTFNALLDLVRQLGPASAVDTFQEPLRGVIEQKGAAGSLLGVGLLGALWSASGYIGAFMRAMNSVYEVKEGRPFWKLRPIQIAITILGVLLVSLVGIALVVSGPLAEAVGNVVGLGSTAVTAYQIAKWPLAVLVVMGTVAALYYLAPNVKQPKFRWVSVGGIVAVLVWIIASVLFGIYVSNFGSYNKTYGSLGSVVVFLLWLWITNLALLFGAELDSELERQRELEAGLPAHEELQLPPREPPKDAEPPAPGAVRDEPARAPVEGEPRPAGGAGRG
jgi:membrane protein